MTEPEPVVLKWNDSVTTERYRILLEVSNAVIVCQTRDELIQVISTHLKAFFSFDRISLSFYDWD